MAIGENWKAREISRSYTWLGRRMRTSKPNIFALYTRSRPYSAASSWFNIALKLSPFLYSSARIGANTTSGRVVTLKTSYSTTKTALVSSISRNCLRLLSASGAAVKCDLNFQIDSISRFVLMKSWMLAVKTNFPYFTTYIKRAIINSRY